MVRTLRRIGNKVTGRNTNKYTSVSNRVAKHIVYPSGLVRSTYTRKCGGKIVVWHDVNGVIIEKEG